MATILVIDPSDAQRAETRAAIERSRLFDRVLEARDAVSGLSLLLAERVDVVVCELDRPGHDGDRLLASRRESPGGPHTPVLLVKSAGAGRARLDGAGDCDVIVRPFAATELVARLGLHLQVKRLRDEIDLKNATLARLASFDALTGLRTRHHGLEFLRFEFLRARRYGTGLGLVLAEVDRFRSLNETHGDATGDAVLRGVARCVLPLRATDVAARFGAAKMLVILTHNSGEGARVIAERWRGAVAGQGFEGPDGHKVKWRSAPAWRSSARRLGTRMP